MKTKKNDKTEHRRNLNRVIRKRHRSKHHNDKK